MGTASPHPTPPAAGYPAHLSPKTLPIPRVSLGAYRASDLPWGLEAPKIPSTPWCSRGCTPRDSSVRAGPAGGTAAGAGKGPSSPWPRGGPSPALLAQPRGPGGAGTGRAQRADGAVGWRRVRHRRTGPGSGGSAVRPGPAWPGSGRELPGPRPQVSVGGGEGVREGRREGADVSVSPRSPPRGCPRTSRGRGGAQRSPCTGQPARLPSVSGGGVRTLRQPGWRGASTHGAAAGLFQHPTPLAVPHPTPPAPGPRTHAGPGWVPHAGESGPPGSGQAAGRAAGGAQLPMSPSAVAGSGQGQPSRESGRLKDGSVGCCVRAT